jgi:succinate dehydrogenase/fumarate reductase-like Fe-S protein
MTEKQLRYELMKKDKQIADLYVVIDTLQTNMRSVSSYLNEDKKNEIETQMVHELESGKRKNLTI